jgi:hypothetical protein
MVETKDPRRMRQRGVPDKTWGRAKAMAAFSRLTLDEWMEKTIEYAAAAQMKGDFRPGD